MRLFWSDDALDDLERIIAYYHAQAGAATASAVQARLIQQILALTDFPERIRKSERVVGARELVIQRLPYIVFVQIHEDVIRVLNIVHTARKFP